MTSWAVVRTCHADGNFATCECLKGFSGQMCDELEPLTTCNPNPCRNGGNCEIVGDPPEDELSCRCAPGFEGSLCQYTV
ncbi:EGF-like domain protein [Ancylostoma duodenale]|uniref:EGF-like domain protein n=1 Tax=Ancylostoma duodenale TaxID=51022 RepID=A0A0C2HCM1_9BILA|nr:EGF-like domain protein [Ancylostoma duodenale]